MWVKLAEHEFASPFARLLRAVTIWVDSGQQASEANQCAGSTTPPTLASSAPSPDGAASAAPNQASPAPGSHHSTGSSTKTVQREGS